MSSAALNPITPYNNPHPSRAELATEASADALMATHARAVAAFRRSSATPSPRSARLSSRSARQRLATTWTTSRASWATG